MTTPLLFAISETTDFGGCFAAFPANFPVTDSLLVAMGNGADCWVVDTPGGLPRIADAGGF